MNHRPVSKIRSGFEIRQSRQSLVPALFFFWGGGGLSYILSSLLFGRPCNVHITERQVRLFKVYMYILNQLQGNYLLLWSYKAHTNFSSFSPIREKSCNQISFDRNDVNTKKYSIFWFFIISKFAIVDKNCCTFIAYKTREKLKMTALSE